MRSMDALALVAGVFTALGSCVSAWTLARHLLSFSLPEQQKHICRLLLLVPVYSISSLLALLAPSRSAALATMRDCYEGFAIYSFFQLLMVYLGGEQAVAEWLELRGHVQHSRVVQRLCPRRRHVQLGHQFLLRVRQGILQFVFVKPTTALLALFFAETGLYEEGVLRLDNAYVYISLVNNVSVSVSLYCLVLFYLSCESILLPFSPLPKFLVVKAVVFFSYWQYCVLVGLNWAGALDSQEQVFELQSSLICIEMFLAALAHHYAFAPSMYDVGEEGRSTMSRIMYKHAMQVHEPVGSHSTYSGGQEAHASGAYGTDSDSEEPDDADSSTKLLPKIFKVLDGRDVIKDGRHAFLDRQKSAEELEERNANLGADLSDGEL